MLGITRLQFAVSGEDWIEERAGAAFEADPQLDANDRNFHSGISIREKPLRANFSH